MWPERQPKSQNNRDAQLYRAFAATWNISMSAELQKAAPVFRRSTMNGLIYLIGLIVVIMFILSFLGLH
jgi:hypothetical protein